VKADNTIVKISSAILIFLLIAPFWISYSSIQFEKYQTKKEIKKLIVSGIDREDLTLLIFASNEIDSKVKWEHDKEFEYNSAMYDVVEKEILGDSVYFWCWEDSEETVLNSRLQALVTKAVESNKSESNQIKQISNFFSSLLNSFHNPFNLFNDKNSIIFEYAYLIAHQNFIKEITPPPPQVNLG
jgi:hypothetical protein